MLHQKAVAVVIMTVSLCCLRAQGQGVVDGPVGVVSSSNTAYDFASARTSPGPTPIGGEASISSSSSSSSHESGAYSTRGDMHKAQAVQTAERKMRPFSTVAVGLRLDTLGPGVEVATPLSQHLNLRSIINSIDYGYKFTIQGGDYNAEVHFHSVQMSLDWFPFHGGFHISPGLMAFNNKLAAQVRVQPGQTFELEGDELSNSPLSQIQGSVTAVYPRRFGPVLMTGFQNILPRTGRHFTVPIEFGVAYPGAAKIINLYLDGVTCTDKDCTDISSDPEIQGLLKKKQNYLNEEMKRVEVYPIVSIGLAYRF